MKHRFAHERQSELRTILSEEGTVSVTPLAKRWKVSEMTIRRDLQALQAERARGGLRETAGREGSVGVEARLSGFTMAHEKDIHGRTVPTSAGDDNESCAERSRPIAK